MTPTRSRRPLLITSAVAVTLPLFAFVIILTWFGHLQSRRLSWLEGRLPKTLHKLEVDGQQRNVALTDAASLRYLDGKCQNARRSYQFGLPYTATFTFSDGESMKFRMMLVDGGLVLGRPDYETFRDREPHDPPLYEIRIDEGAPVAVKEMIRSLLEE